MKFKNLFQLFILCLMAFAVVSCGGDDEESTVDDLLEGAGGNLVGSWVFVDTDGYSETIVFNADGTGTYASQFPGEQPDSETFTYTVSGNVLDITYTDPESDDPSITFAIAGNILTLTLTFPEESTPTIITYTRVS